MSSRKITGMVLAGGQSRRMGQDKALMPLNSDFTLLEWAIDRLDKVCSEVFILSSDPKHIHEHTRLIPDSIDAKGPMSGILAGLMSSESDWNLVLACDMPDVPTEELGVLVAEATLSEPSDALEAIVYEDQQGLQPLCGIYHQRAVKKINKAIESQNFRMMDLLNQLNLKTLSPPKDHPNMLANMNTSGDLPSPKIKVLLFARLKEQAGFSEQEIQCRDLNEVRIWLTKLLPDAGELPYMVAINHEVVRENVTLKDGDEVALMPPFAGG